MLSDYVNNSKSTGRPGARDGRGGQAEAFTLHHSLGFHCTCACAGNRRPLWTATRSANRTGRWCVCGMSPAIVDGDEAGEQDGYIGEPEIAQEFVGIE